MRFHTFLSALAMALLNATLLFAAEPVSDWICLFDGKTLDGWHAAGEGNLAVVDGAILAEGTNRNHGWLISDRAFGDFVLKLRFKWERGNTGVQFRSRYGDDGEMVGYQADLDLSNPDTTGTLHEQGGRRMLQHTLVNGQTICDVDGWNEYEICAFGDHIQLFINGVKTADFRDDRADRGIIAFQAHANQNSRVFFKDIRILPLRPGTHWQPMLNGKNLDNWKQLGDEKWSVENGCIVGRSGPERGFGWLVTPREYGDFVMKFKFRWHGGNSGVQFRSWIKDGQMHGYQADIDPSVDRMTGMLYDEHGEGKLAAAPPAIDAALDKDGWNTYEISAVGDHIRLFVNGIESVDLRHGRTPRGIIALQVHSGGPVHMEWKDLFLLDLNGPAAKNQHGS